MIKLLRSFYKTYQIKQLITGTTRKTKNTQSITDHFATNRPDVITKTGTAEIGLSDHDIIYGMRKISGSKQKTTNIVITRDLKNYDVESFRMDITDANWEDAIDNEDINLASHLWEKEFLAILDKHAPKRARSVLSPHSDHDLRSKMILRDKFKKQFNKTRNTADWEKYIELKNNVNMEKKRKKHDYFADKIRENNGKVKETWKTLNEALSRNSNKPKINTLIINTKETSCKKKNPQEIATRLNNHFTDIAKKVLAENSTEMELITEIPSVKGYVSSINLGGRIFKLKEISLCQISSSCTKKDDK